MPNYIIKSHKTGTIYTQPHMFILNKGLNSGKPQKEPFANSFVIIFSNQEDAESVYWLALALCKSKFWHQFLVGSVIPFLKIQDFKSTFSKKVIEMLSDYENHQKDIKALRLLELKEEQFYQNINLINDLRRVIVYRYCKK